MDIDPNNNNNNYINAYPPPSTTTNFPSSFVGGGNYHAGSTLQPPDYQQQQLPAPFATTTTGSSIGMNHPQQQMPVFGLIVPGCPVRTDFVPMIDSINPALPVTKYSLNISCSTDLNNTPLLSITELVLFATNTAFTSATTAPATPIPPDYGVLCYWQIAEQPKIPLTTLVTAPETTGFALFGALTSTQQSTIYRTGWSEHEQLVTMVQKLSSSTATMNSGHDLVLTIGLSIEPIQNVQNILGDSNNSPAGIMPTSLPSAALTAPDVGSLMNQTINSQTTNHRLLVAQKIALDLFHFMQSFDTPSVNNNMMMVPTNIFDRWYQRFENRYRRDPNFFLKKSD